MKLLLIGFENEEDITAAVNDFMREQDCYVFSIVSSGRDSLSDRWARVRGVPVIYERGNDLEKLGREADYLIYDRRDKKVEPWMRQLVMIFRRLEKHGRIIV